MHLRPLRWRLLALACLATACGGRSTPHASDASVTEGETASPAEAAPDSGLACDPGCTPEESCRNGLCVPACSAGEKLCAQRCTDLSLDPLNCGACGTACGEKQRCISGSCQVVCWPTEARCATGCADLATDPLNCGACGRACPEGAACSQGTCVRASCDPLSHWPELKFLGKTRDASVLALHDFDSDGRLDILEAGLNLTAIHYNRGGRTFESRTVALAGAAPLDAAVADFDGDGRLDLALTWGSPRVALYRSTESGLFAPLADLVTPVKVHGLAAGDVDGDGAADLVLATANGSELRLAASGWTEAQPIGTGRVNTVGLADLNGDGRLDFVEYAGEIAIFLGAAQAGTFLPPQVYGPGLGYRGAIGDLDGDGDLDLVTRYGILLNDGAGQFTVFDEPAVQPRCLSSSGPDVAIGDVTGDGKPDIVQDNLGVEVRIAQAGRFLPPVPILHWGNGAQVVAVGDLDADVVADIVAPTTRGDSAFQIHFGRPALHSGPFYVPTYATAPADFDGDGDRDLLIDYHSSLWLSLGEGNGAFGPLRKFEGNRSSVTADLDGDGDLDLVNCGNLSLLLNDGHGAFTPLASFGPGAKAAVVGDIDWDEVPEVVYATSTGVHRLDRKKDGTYASWPILEVPLEGNVWLALRDLDGNHHLDLLLGDRSARKLWILRNLGAGFASSFAREMGFSDAMALADFDLDGSVELLVGSDRSATVYRGLGGSRLEEHTIELSSWVRGFSVTDLNMDGYPDVLTQGPTNTGAVEILFGGPQGLGAPVAKVLPDGFLLAVGDVDVDGLPDLLLGAYQTPKRGLYFLKGACSTP